jgi:hypothetical protein
VAVDFRKLFRFRQQPRQQIESQSGEGQARQNVSSRL